MEPHRILVVEDDPTNGRLVKTLLEKAGFRVRLEPGGMEGIEAARAEPPDLVLLDLMMPEVDGFQVLAALKPPGAPDPVVIFLSAVTEPAARVKALNLGADDYVLKPFHVRELLARVQMHSRHKRLREEMAQRAQQLEALNARISRGFDRSIQVMCEVIEAFDADLGGHCKRTAELARALAEKMGVDRSEVDQIAHAARLMDIGLIGLPRQLGQKSEDALSSSERVLYCQHPALGAEIIRNIDGLEQAAVLVRHHHERFGGGGFPDGLKGAQIPLGSRILAVAARFERLIEQARSGAGGMGDALYAVLKERQNQLDPAVVETLRRSVLVVQKLPFDERRLPLGELKEGMCLTRDVKSGDGRLLLARGVKLSQPFIEKLMSCDRLTPIVDDVYVLG